MNVVGLGRAERDPRRRHRQDRRLGRLARPRVGHRPGHRPLHHRVGARSPLQPERLRRSSCRASATSARTPQDPARTGASLVADGRLQGLHRQPRRPQPAQAGRARRAAPARSSATRAREPSRATSSSPPPADIFIPAALELEIGVNEAKALKVQAARRGRQRPDLPRGRADPRSRRASTLIPDILANSGGVVVSYYEWLQNKRSERWDLEEVESASRSA